MLDLRTKKTRYVAHISSGSTLASWSPDDRWILLWTGSRSASIGADGVPLDAVSVASGETVRVVPSLLQSRAMLTWCGDRLIAAAGSGRELNLNKRLVAARAPSWHGREIATQPSGAVYWPDCSPDGKEIAATVTPDQPERAFGTNRRQVAFFDFHDPGGGFGAAAGSAEYPRWSRVPIPGEGLVILYVARHPTPHGPASIYLQVGERAQHVADLGRVTSFYDDFHYDRLFDWYQPIPPPP
jgi:hypothetical protein